MKKLVIVLLLIFLTIISFSQLTFNNIPLGTSYQDFKIKLQEKGFIFHPVEGDDNSYYYTGEFIGKDAEIMVLITPKTKIVWKVAVYLPELSNWNRVKSEFLYLCEKMEEKYGSPTDKFTFFSDPYYEGDGYELQAIYKEKCHYGSFWGNDNGDIFIHLMSFKYETAQITIYYEDKKATAIYLSEKDQIIKDGL
jgi:hypothetical protein